MIGIAKTIKLFIGGEFPRTESGRSFKVMFHQSNKVYANLCLSSRKDFRTAVEASEKGHKDWFSKTAFNRSQILYRMAEMMEGKRLEFVSLFELCLGMKSQQANLEVDKAIESFVYFSGFCDKYMQLLSNLNPINGPFANFSAPEPMGIVVLFANNNFNFGNLIANICSVISGGNSLILLMDQEHPCPALLSPLAETLATSDLPGGVVNILTGSIAEILPYVGSHMSVRSISFQDSNLENLHKIKELSVMNLKRVIPLRHNPLSLEAISDTLEIKTTWQPMGF